ncbi:MAG: site-specific integrase [Muribaculaceae bacterium]|nr:site-specific integrase [Muribaculaceae bacterium]
MTIKKNIRYAVITKKSDPAEGYVQATITWNSRRVRICPGLAVSLSGWIPDRGRCKPRSYHGVQKTPGMTINSILDEFEEKVDELFRNYEVDERIPEVSEIRIALAVKESKVEDVAIRKNDASQRVAPVFELYCNLNERDGLWRNATVLKNRRIKDLLLSLSPTLTFEELERDDALSRLLLKFSMLEGKGKAKGLSNTTVTKNLAFIRTFLRWAHEKGYVPLNRFCSQKARLKTSHRTVVFLTWDELMSVYYHDYSLEPAKERVRDAFCFCCFTSLRFSDMTNLKWSNVGDDFIEVTTVKTSDKIRIDLNKYSRSLLDKYRGLLLPEHKVFPVISNQKFNDHLKEIGRDCGITTPLSFTEYRNNRRIDNSMPKFMALSSHAGRRTFICNALSMGIPPDVVMKWTGHSDYSAMRPYIDISDEAKRNAMKLFNEV